MSSIVMPLRSSSLRVAGIGPVSMMTGSTPTVVWSRTRARGRRPWRSAASREASRTPAAPSQIGEEVPAVIRPSFSRKTVLSAASPSAEVPGRMVWSLIRFSPSSSSGIISRSKRPAATASAASRCERTANSSISPREMSQRSAISSALSPCGTKS
nr:hypothetical protein [Streptomyces liliiviolaceus]